MVELDGIRIFVKVAEFESITRAARSLGTSISTVSRRLSVLESELGVSLLRRTTRRISLTAQGRDYLNQCREPLSLLQEAERVLIQRQRKVEGLLRITVPVTLGRDPFLEFLSRFQKTNPRIHINLFITNLFLDLVAENLDVAIRFGDPRDSSLVARRLGKTAFHLAASPEYLKARPVPAEPAELELHECVMLNAKNNETDWELVNGRRKVRVHVRGTVSSRDHLSLSTFVYRGHGIGLLPAAQYEEAVAAGRLLRILPGWSSPEIPVFAIYPSRKFLPARLRAFLDALVAWKSPVWTRN
jgi:DNA-binding transcriptional LysR family regulator